MVAMKYEWTPASEPPDTDRPVQVWYRSGGHGVEWFDYNFYWSGWPTTGEVTH